MTTRVFTSAILPPEEDDALEHHGIKGQKWGVRHDPGHVGERATTKKIAKADTKFEKNLSGIKGWVAVQNRMADHINPRLDELNSNPKYKNKNVLDGVNPKLQKAYLKDYEKIIEEAAVKTTNDLGVNPSGTKRLVITRHGDGAEATWAADWASVSHAAETLPSIIFKPVFDPVTGHIIRTMITMANTATHTAFSDDEFIDNILEHHGIKGMKWGVSKAQAARVGAATASSAKRAGNNIARSAKSNIHDVRTSSFKPTANTHRVGVNSVHTKKVQKFVDQSNRVAQGKGSRRDKASVVARANVVTLARNNLDVKAVAAKQAKQGQAHIDRINTGKANALDTLTKFGTLTLLDVAKANRQVPN